MSNNTKKVKEMKNTQYLKLSSIVTNKHGYVNDCDNLRVWNFINDKPQCFIYLKIFIVWVYSIDFCIHHLQKIVG